MDNEREPLLHDFFKHTDDDAGIAWLHAKFSDYKVVLSSHQFSLQGSQLASFLT